MNATGLNVLDCSSQIKNPFRYIVSFYKFLINFTKSDIILIGFLGHFLIPIARIFTRKPIIFDSFVSIYMTMCLDRKKFSPNGILSRLAKWIDTNSCRIADIVLCDTQEHIKFFCDAYSLDPKKFIRIWVGTDEAVMYPREEIQEKRDLIHFHGEFQPLHGVEHIIRASKLLPEVKFRFIGKGRTREQCEQIIQSLKISNIELLDPVPYEKLPELMAEAAICLGIFGDSIKAKTVIPHKAFEALAVRKPLITADTPAAKELLSHHEDAYLCEPSAHGIAAAIQELLSHDEQRCLMARKGYEKFKQKCSVDALRKTLYSICETLYP